MSKIKVWKPKYNSNLNKRVLLIKAKLLFQSERIYSIYIEDDIELESPVCFRLPNDKIYIRLNWKCWLLTISSDCYKHEVGRKQCIKLSLFMDCSHIETKIQVYDVKEIPDFLFEARDYSKKYFCRSTENFLQSILTLPTRDRDARRVNKRIPNCSKAES